MEVYERIKNRRKELDLSADDVADALGVSRATIYRYESADIKKMPITILEPLAKVLKCSPTDLLFGEDSPRDTAASISFSDPDKNWLIHLYDELDPDRKEALLTRADELYKLQQLDKHEKDVERLSFTASDAEGIA